jgi:rhodanese-related sulfurtransferase
MNSILPEQLKARLDAGEKLNIIDVREPSEYAEYNISGKLIPLGQIQVLQIDEIEHLKNEEVIIHCKVGGRSTQACMILETAGFTNVVNLVGGMVAWKAKFGQE